MTAIKKSNVLFFLFVLLSGCSQHEPGPQLLTGDWLWTSTSGGFGYVLIGPASTDRVVLRLTDSNQFAVFRNDTLVRAGNFRITKEHSIYSGKEENKLTVNGSVSSNPSGQARLLVIDGIIESLSDTQLSIGDNMYDGYGSSFIRQ